MVGLADQAKRALERGSGGIPDMPVSAVTTRGRRAEYRPRSTRFVESQPVTRDLIESAERTFMVGPPSSIGDILASVGEGASIYSEGHYPIVRIGSNSLTWAGAWFGDDDYTEGDCEDVWAWLASTIRGTFDPAAAMLQSPGVTGRDLWLRSIGKGVEYPVLPIETQDRLRSAAGQGRIETFPARGPHLRFLYEYDARLAYLGVTRELPIGEPRQAEQDDYLTRPHQRSRWLVTFKAPADWGNRPGILPVPLSNGSWHWPTGRAGYGPTWVDGVELALAVRHCWPVEVREGYVWTHTADPFRTWQDRLLRIMAAGAERFEGVRAAMLRAAVRGMILHTFGTLHGSPRKTTGIGTARQVPADASNIRTLSDGRMAWTTYERPAWPELVHPEWTAAIWSRARARLLDAPTALPGVRAGLLHVDPATIVAVRTDAIYLSEPAPFDRAGADDGKAGRYRLKGRWSGPWPWPRTGRDILTIKGTGDAF